MDSAALPRSDCQYRRLIDEMRGILTSQLLQIFPMCGIFCLPSTDTETRDSQFYILPKQGTANFTFHPNHTSCDFAQEGHMKI